MTKNNLQIRAITAPVSDDLELDFLQVHLGDVLSIILGGTIKLIKPAPFQDKNSKKSVLLRFSGGPAVEINFHSMIVRNMFRGILDLGRRVLENPALQIEEITPGILNKNSLCRTVCIQTSSCSEYLTISADIQSFSLLPKTSLPAVHDEFQLRDPEIEFSIVTHSKSESTNNKQIIALSTVGILIQGELNQFGDIVVKEVVMSTESTGAELKAEIKLGTISLKLRDLLELRPGSLIEIDWAKDACGVLCVGGKEWTKVQLSIANGLLSLNIPTDATFPTP